ncbi:ABC transporter ATP-binding protein [Halobium palmae]|uniref:ABC-type D-xylose/L-arabinose transporter n=1 Tax=Halobium palmae TaxID=1776492 RepID=A0ABD5RWP3_9EURY
MPAAAYNDVSKVFEDGNDKIVAVEDLSIEIQDGEFLVLVGPSGCGKSTTLRLLAGLETITEGEVTVQDKIVNDEKPKDRDIAMVFQNYALYPHKTVRENMAFGLEMTTSLSNEEIGERVHNAAEILDITELLDRRPNALSGGQKQRVALGRAIVRKPSVFLMDEPLSNLDAKLRTQMRTELQELHNEIGVATVYVTHDQTEAMTMGDRIAVLNAGELQQIGTPLELYHQPVNEFVAGFIGSPSMNILELKYDQAAGTATDGDVTYKFTEDQLEKLAEAGVEHVNIGIRPEDIELADGEGPRTVTADVSVVEPMGEESYLHLNVGRHELTASIDGDYIVGNDQQIRVELPESRVHAFHPDSGEAIFNRNRDSEELPTGAAL